MRRTRFQSIEISLLTISLLTVSLLTGVNTKPATANDGAWPCYMHDSQRTGIVADTLELPLQLTWEYIPVHPPATGLAAAGAE